MLKNLIKYEFKATGRTLGLLYTALIIIACVSRLILGLNNFNDGMGGSAFPFVGIISALIVFLYAMFLCAVVVITFIVILLRFYKNLLQNEGYLMNMLPVKKLAAYHGKADRSCSLEFRKRTGCHRISAHIVYSGGGLQQYYFLCSGRRMEQREVRFLSDGGQRSVYSLYDSGDGRGVYRSLGSAAVCGDVYRSDAEPL